MSEAQTAERQDAPEVMAIKARHQVARMEHEREMALFDQQSFGRMPLALRLMFDDRLRERVQRAAAEMSKAQGFTPQHLLGKTEACLVVVTRAVTWNLDPYSVAMSTYQTPGGKVGYEGALVRAILEASGEIRGAIRQEWYGDWSKLPRPSFRMDKDSKVPRPAWEYWGPLEEGLGVRISATLAQTGEEVSLDFDLVDAYPRNATTWPTRPKLQLLNPAIRAFARQVRPSLLMGVHFREEPSDDEPPMREINPEARAPVAEPAEDRKSALHVIAERNAPPKEERPSAAVAAAEVAKKAGKPHRAAAAAPQQATAAAPVQESQQEASPVDEPATAQQSAILFEATVDGTLYRDREAASDALIRLIEHSTAPGMLVDEYASVLEVLHDVQVNAILDTIAKRQNDLVRQNEEAQRKRLTEETERKRTKSKERPPEPASEARPEPAAEPAPGGADDVPPWVTVAEPERDQEPDSGERYELKDELGKIVGTDLRAGDFLGLLQRAIDDATADNVRRLKIHNRRDLDRAAQNEGPTWADQARDLLP